MRVAIDAFPDLGLIVKAPTGVIYSNKSGGFECLHPEMEGFFVPVRTCFGMRELYGLQTLRWTIGDGDVGIDEETAERLDWMLSQKGLDCIRADRSKLAESWQAWVHVIIAGAMGHAVPVEGTRPETLKGVLTWPNVK